MNSKTGSFQLPTEPEGVIPSLIERFNSGSLSAMMELHDPRDSPANVLRTFGWQINAEGSKSDLYLLPSDSLTFIFL